MFLHNVNISDALLNLLSLISQPQYEKVARLFNGANAVHPGIILMTRVDCANKVRLHFFILNIFIKSLNCYMV